MLIRNTNKHTTNNYTIYYTHYFLSKIVKENNKILEMRDMIRKQEERERIN